MNNLLRSAFATVALVALAGCSSTEPEHTENYPAIHIEPSDSYRGPAANIVMPITGLPFRAIGRPVVPEGNFIAAEVMEVGPPDMRREVILIQVDDRAKGALYNMSVKARGKRLFLFVGEQPVGVHVIEGPILGGDIFFNVEVPGRNEAERTQAIHDLKLRLNEAILEVRKLKEEAK